MPLGTLDRTPPPLFGQGYSATTRLVFFAALALFLMVADARFKVVGPVREALALVLLPVQRALLAPVELLAGGAGYLRRLHAADAAEGEAKRALAALSLEAARTRQLAQENAQLRALLELKPALAVRAQAAEVLYEAGDLFSRKLFVDRGSRQGVALGAPVVNPAGVLGQVTRVYAFTSEVTLLTDKDAAIPVLNPRTQQRGAAFGGGAGGGTMELRFTSANADIRPGDALVTSGLDGVYPPGLAVATVASVDRRAESGFARVVLAPTAPSDGVRHVLVLEPLAVQLPERPAPVAAEAPARGERQLKTPRRPPAASAGGAP
jgi:rod shape-determining protein MreC